MRTLISTLIVAATVVGLSSATAAPAPAPAPAAAPAEFSPTTVVGGWKPIKDVNAPDIQDLGRWAVSEHVKLASDGLVFKRVVSGEEQIVSGTNYKLVIEATDGTVKIATYGAALYVQEWTNKRKLLAFVPAN